MPLRPVSFFTAAYAEKSLQVRKKSRILATINIIFGLVSVVFAILMAVTNSIVPAFVFAGLVLFCAVVLMMLRSGRYHAASSIFLYGVFAAMFVAIKFGEYAANVYNTYVMGTLGGFLLVVAALVADRPVQAIVIGLLNLASIEAIYWIDSFPNDKYVVTTLAIQNLSVSSLMTIIGAGISAYIVSFTTSLLGVVEREAKSAERSYDELNSAMGRAHSSSQRIGESLSASVARTTESIDALRARVRGIAEGMDELDRALNLSGEANRKAGNWQGEVKIALAAYSEQVARASAAIEEMAAAAGSLASQATSKKEAVGGLVETSKAGERVLASMGQSMVQIQGSAAKVAELGGIIGDIADRTNLLGMNASIEAAHAGAAGRGFAVVANEIRALSVEAGKSAHVIADTLKEVRSSIESTVSKSGEAMASFKKISEDIRGVSLMIDELLSSIQELSAGSSDVVAAVETVAELTRSTESAVDRSCEGMDESFRGMDTVAEIASKVRVETSEISTRFDDMHKDSEQVRKLGGENLETIQALKSSLDGFALNDGNPDGGTGSDHRGIRVKSGAR